MKKLVMAAAAAAAITSMADIRLSEYGQVAGVSNQVMSVDAISLPTAKDKAVFLDAYPRDFSPPPH